MTIGPAPMIKIEEMSVLFGIGTRFGVKGQANCRAYRGCLAGCKRVRAESLPADRLRKISPVIRLASALHPRPETSPEPDLALSPQILFEFGPSGAADLFVDPIEIITARTTEDVMPALLQAEGALQRGFWVAGFLSYEAGYALEPKLVALMPENRRVPMVCFGVFAGPNASAAKALLIRADSQAAIADLSAQKVSLDETAYAAVFAKVMDLIQAGDIYQANLSMPMQAQMRGNPLALWGALRRKQSVRHGALVQLNEEVTLLSRSPEMFFRTSSDGLIEARPMKGTAPRNADAAIDAAVAEILRNDPKNRAENLMIVDLLRNDLGRICRIGSIQVPELFAIESYATVHQMVSQVQGRLMPGVGLAKIFKALFPCGSVTGAPKIRAMEVIEEVETQPREVYCGSIGWAAPDGRAVFSVAIRTLHLYGESEIVLNAGGGIVADSTAQSEYDEALWKARFAALPKSKA